MSLTRDRGRDRVIRRVDRTLVQDDGTWTFEGEIARTGAAGSVITLVEGADFCLSGRNGDIRPGSPHGLFLLDSRFLSQLELGTGVNLCITAPNSRAPSKQVLRARERNFVSSTTQG